MVDKLLPDLDLLDKSNIDPANDLLLIRDASTGYDKKFNPPTTITADLLKDGGIVLDDTATPGSVGLDQVPNEDATDMANFDQKGALDGYAIVWNDAENTWEPGSVEVPVDSVNGQTGDVSLSSADIGGNVSEFTNDANYVSENGDPTFNSVTADFFKTVPQITSNYTVSSTHNEMVVGPIEIADGVTVTVEGEWVII